MSTMIEPKQFTDADIVTHGETARIYCDKSELMFDPPAWMSQGLTETATGYGKRLNSGYRIHFNGRLYRVYVTCFSNCGTAWFRVRGRQIIVD